MLIHMYLYMYMHIVHAIYFCCILCMLPVVRLLVIICKAVIKHTISTSATIVMMFEICAGIVSSFSVIPRKCATEMLIPDMPYPINTNTLLRTIYFQRRSLFVIFEV